MVSDHGQLAVAFRQDVICAEVHREFWGFLEIGQAPERLRGSSVQPGNDITQREQWELTASQEVARNPHEFSLEVPRRAPTLLNRRSTNVKVSFRRRFGFPRSLSRDILKAWSLLSAT